MFNNRRGQLSDAMVWLVATIIIVVLLVGFIYAADLMGKANAVRRTSKEILLNDESEENINLLEEKTKIAYGLNSGNKNKIEEWINEE